MSSFYWIFLEEYNFLVSGGQVCRLCFYFICFSKIIFWSEEGQFLLHQFCSFVLSSSLLSEEEGFCHRSLYIKFFYSLQLSLRFYWNSFDNRLFRFPIRLHYPWSCVITGFLFVLCFLEPAFLFPSLLFSVLVQQGGLCQLWGLVSREWIKGLRSALPVPRKADCRASLAVPAPELGMDRNRQSTSCLSAGISHFADSSLFALTDYEETTSVIVRHV